MKLCISKDEIQDKLANIQNIVEKKNTMPILSHFLLTLGKQQSYIMATDLQVAIKEPITATVQGEGNLCIPAKKLFEIVREADGDINIESEDGQWIKVISGKSRFRLACLPAAEFPAWPGMENNEAIVFKTATLLEMIEKTLYSAGENDTRQALNGLLFHILPDKKEMTVVGTDGHRLAVITKGLEAEASEGKKVILPRKAAAELRRFIGSSENVSVVFGKNHALFKVGDIHFLARLIEGSYPDYEQVIPASNDKLINIDRNAFLKALKRVSVMSKERSNAVRMDVGEGSLAMSSSNPDIGEARDEIEVEYNGEPLAAGFNARYLIDSLNAMTTEKVVFELKDSLSPTLLKEAGTDDYKCVVMPMRL